MAKRNRWTPPHAEPTPASIRRERQEHPTGQCHWVRCYNDVWPVNPDTKLCFKHAEAVDRAITHHRRATDAQRAAAREAAVYEFNVDTRTTLDPLQAEGSIYFVATDGLIKIGFSTNPAQRLRHYSPNAVVLAVYPGTMAKEKYIHGQFAHALAKGREWFHDRPDIRQYIAERVAENGEPDPRYTKRFREAREKTEIVASKRWSGTKKTAA